MFKEKKIERNRRQSKEEWEVIESATNKVHFGDKKRPILWQNRYHLATKVVLNYKIGRNLIGDSNVASFFTDQLYQRPMLYAVMLKIADYCQPHFLLALIVIENKSVNWEHLGSASLYCTRNVS